MMVGMGRMRVEVLYLIDATVQTDVFTAKASSLTMTKPEKITSIEFVDGRKLPTGERVLGVMYSNAQRVIRFMEEEGVGDA